MKFSVVTVSFNQRQYLEEALTSVLAQDYPAIEYIVVDPGSTDGSRELIESFRDRLASMVFEADQGAADGLNKGFQRASGDIFGFLNSDDVLLPGAMKTVSRAFEQNPDCDIVMGNGFIVDAMGKRIRRIRAAGFTLDRYFYGGATWLQQATFFRRTAFEQVGGFNVNNRSCWDGELVVDNGRGHVTRLPGSDGTYFDPSRRRRGRNPGACAQKLVKGPVKINRETTKYTGSLGEKDW